ncbi:hypothetical protein BDV59DRAFT_188850, partial [Aspergillus ambiguus]|uniref:uncharacterized protein n=1 Tax=Aspergillus ambiguus TaxID=176160 RepID=UPI003CCDFEAD
MTSYSIDITAMFACRLVKHLSERKALAATPRMQGPSNHPQQHLWALKPTYMATAEGHIPKFSPVLAVIRRAWAVSMSNQRSSWSD